MQAGVLLPMSLPSDTPVSTGIPKINAPEVRKFPRKYTETDPRDESAPTSVYASAMKKKGKETGEVCHNISISVPHIKQLTHANARQQI
jgi:hypothetical protein